jgi:DNA-binding NarL/FixJ family response regulator
MRDSVRILIVDDHQIVRQGVKSILAERPDWQVCGEASNGQEAIESTMALHPDLIIMDITMPVMNGLDAAARISSMRLGALLLVLTMHEFEPLVRDIRRVGARGYVQKARAGRDLICAIDALLEGRTYFATQTKPEPSTDGGASAAGLAHRMILRIA